MGKQGETALRDAIDARSIVFVGRVTVADDAEHWLPGGDWVIGSNMIGTAAGISCAPCPAASVVRMPLIAPPPAGRLSRASRY